MKIQNVSLSMWSLTTEMPLNLLLWGVQSYKQASLIIMLPCYQPGIHDDHHGNGCWEQKILISAHPRGTNGKKGCPLREIYSTKCMLYNTFWSVVQRHQHCANLTEAFACGFECSLFICVGSPQALKFPVKLKSACLGLRIVCSLTFV